MVNTKILFKVIIRWAQKFELLIFFFFLRNNYELNCIIKKNYIYIDKSSKIKFLKTFFIFSLL